MKYDLKRLIQQYKDSPNIDFLFFWGHQPSSGGEITKSCLSQWWPCAFADSENIFISMEQYMMAKKAALFNDSEIEKEILSSTDPKQLKQLGRMVRNFAEDVWKENAYRIVREGNFLKFSQSKDLGRFLIQTGTSVLVEASPFDKIWGIGLSQNDKPKILNPESWQGDNMLGFALMEVRDLLT